jgi:hypothetical protein
VDGIVLYEESEKENRKLERWIILSEGESKGKNEWIEVALST